MAMPNAAAGKNKFNKTFIPVASKTTDTDMNANIVNQANLACGREENFLGDKLNTNYYFKLNFT